MFPQSRLAITAALALLLLVLVAAVLLLRPTTHTTPGACTHWAAPTGEGSSCTDAAPCQVASWWPLARPGGVLCLLAGTYRGYAAMIDPPDTLAGTQAAPLTVKAVHDGQVLLDAEHERTPVILMPGNDWWVIEGINASNGKESVYKFGGNHGRGRRLIGYTGTSGQDDSNIFTLSRGVDNVIEDCAGWGDNSRKILSGSQVNAPGEDAQQAGFRRCWGEWNDHPQGASQPSNTYQLGYRTRGQRFENVIGTWQTRGQVAGAEAVLSFFYDCEQSDTSMRAEVLGSLFYLAEGQPTSVNAAVKGFCSSNLTFKDVVGYVAPSYPDYRPFVMLYQTSKGPQSGNVCQNCLSIHAGTPSQIQNNTGWTLPGWREGQGLADATGGVSAFTLLPGLCYRYEQGTLSNVPLWPWPMNARILEARVASGYPPVDVTATVEAMLGKIPDGCRSDRQPVPPEPGPSPAALSCTGDLLAGGKIALVCTPQEGRR